MLDGYRTMIVAFAGSVITLLTAFGVGITDVQREAIMNFLLVGWPVAMVVMRLITTGPTKFPEIGDTKPKDEGFARPGLLTFILVVALAFGCAANPQQSSFSDGIGKAYLAIDTAAMVIYEACGNTIPDGPCEADSLISTEDKQRAKSALNAALINLQTAREFHNEGSTTLAMERLQHARLLIAMVEQMVQEDERIDREDVR